MYYKYIVHYLYGDIGGEVGCSTYNQTKIICQAIALWVERTRGGNVEFSIQNVETGEVEPFTVY